MGRFSKSMSTLKEFISQIRDGMARPNHFSVELSLPKILANDELIKPKMGKIMLFCEQSQLPGVSFMSSQVRSFGEFKEVPYEKLYEPVSLSFYVDSDFIVKRLFDKWINAIQDTRSRIYLYPDEYLSASITIYAHDVENNKKYSCILHNCYPKAVSPIQLDYNSKDVMRLGVQLSYKYFTTDQKFSAAEKDKNKLGGFSINDIINKAEEKLMNYGHELASSAIPSNYFTAFDEFQESVGNTIENTGSYIGSAIDDFLA